MFKPAFKLILIVLWGILCFIPLWLAYLFRQYKWRDEVMQVACRGILKIAGVQLSVYGTPSDGRPLLVVSNHLSYMDIMLLASQSTLYFTPKSEIARWPVIGYLCKITGCVFIDRRPGQIKAASELIRQKLLQGDAISIFPEATTGAGVHVLPFKSGFMNLALQDYEEGKTLHVQPVAMTYTGASNLPMDLRLWHKVAWYGDMELVPHLWEFLSLSPVKAELHYLPAVAAGQFDDRKALAAHCHRQIEKTIETIRMKIYTPARSHSTPASLALLKGKSK